MTENQHKGEDVVAATALLSNLGIKCQIAEDINYRDIPCDFIGFDNESWHIVEVKTDPGDCERAITQILRYYDTLKWSKYNQNAPKGYKVKSKIRRRIYDNTRDTTADYAKINRETKEPIPLGKKEIKLYLLFNRCSGLRKFEEYHTLFKTYIDNPNCPNIDFYHLDENDKPVRL